MTKRTAKAKTTEVDPLLAQQLRQLEQAAQTQLTNLKATTEETERTLAQIEAHVAAGNMGAELVAPMETAVNEAKKLMKEWDQKLDKVQKQIAKLEK